MTKDHLVIKDWLDQCLASRRLTKGVTQEALLAIVIDRLRSFQAGPFSCRENAIALTHCEEALMWLQRRTFEVLPELHRERKGMKYIYLASNFYSREDMKRVANKLEQAGCVVTSRWIYTTLEDSTNRNFAEENIQDLEAANTLVLFSEDLANTSSRGGKHVEFGYALGKGKRVVVCGPVKNLFQNLAQVERVQTEDELLALLG